jgi:sugar/nucleoside kinase (ribokinase family)
MNFRIQKGIAVIGSTTIDQIIHQNRRTFKAGGVTVYSGMTYSQHGIKTGVITNIADRNRQVIACLRKQRIRVHNGQTRQTTHFINDIRPGDRRQKNPQRAAPIRRQQVLDHVKDVDGVHLGPLHPKDIDIGGIKSLKGLDRPVILDIQGLVRTVKNGNVDLAVSQQLNDALNVSQIVKANRHEYAVMLDYFQTDLMTLMQRFNIHEFIVTSGASGGFVQGTTAAATPYAAASVKYEGDPTGAGDIFLAAYVTAHLRRRRSIPDACQYAARLVAQQIEGKYITEDVLRLKKPLRLTK